MDTKTHYDLLIEENNDPFHDPPVLQKYMESWDGPAFLDMMELDESRTVLEIGVGTGRLAAKTAGRCRHLLTVVSELARGVRLFLYNTLKSKSG